MPERRRRKSYLNVGGHPVHALAVPVPLGLYVVAFLAAVMSVRRPWDAFWPRAWRLASVGATTTSTTAAVAGLVDFLTLVRSARARKVGVAHLLLNSGALGLQIYGLRAGGGAGKRLWLQSAVLSLVSAAGFAGGELVYRHRVGVFGGKKGGRGRRPGSSASH